MSGSLLTLAKKQAVIEEDHDDDLVALYIRAAIAEAERVTGLSLRPQQKVLELTIDDAGKATLRQAPCGPVQAFWADPCCGDRALAPVLSGADVYFPGVPAGARVRIAATFGYAEEAALIDQLPDVVAGILKYTVHAYENRGDSNRSSWLADSGALDHWRTRQRVAA